MLMISIDELMDILEEYAVCSPDEKKSLRQRINQASMFIDNIKTADKWISVKDRLPANDGLYIVCRTIYPYQIVFEAKWEDGKWVSVVEPKQLGYITHWMPLPEPPKEK